VREHHIFCNIFQTKNGDHVVTHEYLRARADVFSNFGPQTGGISEEVSHPSHFRKSRSFSFERRSIKVSQPFHL